MEDISKKIIFSKDEYIRKDIKWIGIESKKGFYVLINNEYSSRGKMPGKLPGSLFRSYFKEVNIYYLYGQEGFISTFAFEKGLKELERFNIEEIIKDKILYTTQILFPTTHIFQSISLIRKRYSILKNESFFDLKITESEIKHLFSYTYNTIFRQQEDIRKWKQSLPK